MLICNPADAQLQACNDAQLHGGGQERQENCWVGDLTKNGAKEVQLESEVPVWPSCFDPGVLSCSVPRPAPTSKHCQPAAASTTTTRRRRRVTSTSQSQAKMLINDDNGGDTAATGGTGDL